MIATALPSDQDAALRLSLTLKRKQRDADPWRDQRRPNQTPPDGHWTTWLVMAGRGFGKSRCGAEFVRESIMAGRSRRVALVAPTAADARDIMVEGESGMLACCARYGFRAKYKPSLRRVDFANGARATLYSAEEPDRLRGPQHDLAWSDEIGAWARGVETWDNLQFGLRLSGPNGSPPRQIATTTPRVVTLVRSLVKQSATGAVAITRGSTYDNAENLAPAFLESIRDRYEGTRLGRQEIAGELLEDVEGALWTLAQLDAARLRAVPDGVAITRVVIGVDPPASTAECGIVAVGLGSDKRGYVLADVSRYGTPNEWGEAVWRAVDHWQANEIVIEVNQGGKMATNVLQMTANGQTTKIETVHAAKGKISRAEPVSALYEQGRIAHVGSFPALEDQMSTYVADGKQDSPDRMDALVWAVTRLMVKRAAVVVAAGGVEQESRWRKPV